MKVWDENAFINNVHFSLSSFFILYVINIGQFKDNPLKMLQNIDLFAGVLPKDGYLNAVSCTICPV